MDAIFLLLLCLLVLSCSSSSSLATNSDGEILLSFKAAITDPARVLQSWDADLVDPCTWFHVTCNNHNRVVRIDLGNAGLSGHLIPQLGSLSFLQYLELFKNELNGSIPRELGKLKSLIALDLFDNHLSGHIPQQLDGLSSLSFLRLSGNRLTGAIPFSLTTISTLDVLELSHNELRGVIPTNGSFVKFNASSFFGNPGLCGNVVGKPCTH